MCGENNCRGHSFTDQFEAALGALAAANHRPSPIRPQTRPSSLYSPITSNLPNSPSSSLSSSSGTASSHFPTNNASSYAINLNSRSSHADLSTAPSPNILSPASNSTTAAATGQNNDNTSNAVENPSTVTTTQNNNDNSNTDINAAALLQVGAYTTPKVPSFPSKAARNKWNKAEALRKKRWQEKLESAKEEIAAQNNLPIPSSCDTPLPAASQKNAECAVKHNQLCESCGEGGAVVCCEYCNLVFHLGCHRPVLDVVPNGPFICSFCVLEGKTSASECIIEKAKEHTQQILHLKGDAQKRLQINDDHGKERRDASPPCVDQNNNSNPPKTTVTADHTNPQRTPQSLPVDGVLPHSSLMHIDGFIQAFHKHRHSKKEVDAILQKLFSDEYAHHQIKVGLERLSLKAPIENQAIYNNQKVDWSKCAKEYPVDKRAFRNYTTTLGQAVSRHDAGEEDTPAALKREEEAKNHAKGKVISAFRTVGNHEQRRLVLLHFLSDPEIRNIASSIGVNLREARVGRHILNCYRRLMSRTQKTSNKNGRLINHKRAMVQALSVAAVKTPPKKDAQDANNQVDDGSKKARSKRPKSEVSLREISQQLGFSSYGSGFRNLKKGEEKRASMADGRVEGWVMIDEEEERTKFTPEFLDALEDWIENNEKVAISPEKGDDLYKHDREGKIVKDEQTGVAIKAQRRILMVSPRELHNFMIDDFPLATEGDKVIVSESKIRKLLKTSCRHVTKVTKRQKLMCGCAMCVIFEDMHQCVIQWRKKYLKREKEEVSQLRGRSRSRREEALRKYVNEVANDEDGKSLKHQNAWDAASQIGCNKVLIGDRHYPLFSCVLHKCDACAEKWGEIAPKMELECEDRISYVLFGTHKKCSYHGDENMGISDGEYICLDCKEVSDVKKKRLKGGIPKVKSVKVRVKLSERMKDFIKPGGTYEQYLRKMYFHTAHVKLFGSKFCAKKCYEFAETVEGALIMEVDYSERYQPVYMREIQSENFGKDADVSIEVRIANYKAQFDGPDKPASKRTISYAHLSDEKLQTAATTYENTMQMLKDIIEKRGDWSEDDLQMIIDIVDGCPAQYKCFTALYTLALVANITGKRYIRCVKCAGHGKCRCDAEGGCHKKFADKSFDKFVMLPEDERVGCQWVPTHKVEDGSLLSLAEIVCNVLQDPDYVRGARSHSARKAKDKRKVIDERRFLLRRRGDAKLTNIKMTGIGFDDGEHMGLRAHHCFIADPEVAGFVVMVCRIPCFCSPCQERMKKPVGERYQNPRNDCEYWEMYNGWNDWRTISFMPTAKCDSDELVDSQELTVRSRGERMKRDIVVGEIGAYSSNGEYGYYLVEWTQEPWVIEDDCVEVCGEEERQLKKGDWVCRGGRWLNYVPRARHWYTKGGKEVLVRCQTILQSGILLVPHGPNNDMPRMKRKSREEALKLNPIRVQDEDHDFLMDAASLLEGLDYEVEVPDAPSDSEDEEEEDGEEELYLSDVEMDGIEIDEG